MATARFVLLVLALASGRVAAESVTVSVPSFTPVASVQAGGQTIRAAGYGLIGSPGDPALPFTDIHVIIPPDAIPESVSARISGSTRHAAPVQHEIRPAPPIAASIDGRELREWGRGKKIRGDRNVLVYERSALYPKSNLELVSVGALRQWRIVTLRYYPYRYNPVGRVLEHSTSGNIVVSYRKGSGRPVLPSHNSPLAKRISALAANYAQARRWYSVDTAGYASAPAEPQSMTDYVIITRAAVVAGSSKLQSFVDHKTARGFSVAVLTESDWGGGTGDTAATNIRSYLQTNYLSKGIQYVLLVGNPDPVVGDVPMKMLWPRYSSNTYREAPSDYFYADLTGNWDFNGNGYYGEEFVDFGPGGVDRFADVIVGRIPFYGDFADLDSILQKTINYESVLAPGGWIRNVLLSMKPSDSSTPGYQLGEAIRTNILTPASMNATRCYDGDYGLTPAPEHVPCTYNNVLTAWQQHAGFHFWWTHGGETLAADVFRADSCQDLDDGYPAFTFQCSCLNAAPENGGNLAYSLLKRGAISTDAATRVSWYYVGEDQFAVSDSNAGMTYDYAGKLIGQHMPCGDAHFAMMADVPNEIWMNHCVFNLYGDPSIRYPMAPTISHTPLQNTDVTTQPYTVAAEITATSLLAPGQPILNWNTDGGQTFSTVQMNPTTGTSYAASIPAQSYGTTVYYYIEASDISGLGSTAPTDAPQSLLSFSVMPDSEPPTIVHTPLGDTADKFGPYVVDAVVTDDMGIGDVWLHYCSNGGAYSQVQMALSAGDHYHASIPGPAQSGDIISYYITATDSSLNANQSRLPAGSDSYSFSIGSKICVAVLNSTASPSYFVGGNLNDWQTVSGIFEDDPSNRFQVSVVTNLVPTPGSISIEGQDVLVLPDNGVPTASLQAVSDWFQEGKVIVAMDSATSYASYTGWMWPSSAGSNTYGINWEYGAEANDQQIWSQDPITAGYTIGQIIGSVFGDSVFFVNKLPPDAKVLAVRSSNHARAYAVYRDVPGRGRLVILGPYIRATADQHSIIREAAIGPAHARQLGIVCPNGGEAYISGDIVPVTFACSGAWQDSDTISLEYCTGLDQEWLPVPGAQSLMNSGGAFQWNTAGLRGSHGYIVRATWAGGTLSDQSDAGFTILPTVDIVSAKWIEDGELIKVAGKVVTSGIADMAYVEEPDRRAGIRIAYNGSLTPNSLVDIVGTMGSLHGERVLNAESVEVRGYGAQIRPFATIASALGGAAFGLQEPLMEWHSQQLRPTLGLNNIGLLVRLAGKVSAVGEGFFYLDDGSQCTDSSTFPGVRVIVPAALQLSIGDHVSVDAISSTYFDGSTTWRALVLSDRQNLQTQ